MSAGAPKNQTNQRACKRRLTAPGWLCSGLALFLTVSAGAVVPAGHPTHAAPLFADARFQKGFLLSHPDSSKGRSVEAVLDFGDPNNVPVWRLCQWATKHSLAPAQCLRSEGAFSYENQAKRVVVGRSVSQDDELKGLTLEIRGGAEYGARARKAGEAWPHLLVEQDAVQVRALDALEAIRLRVRLRLLHCKSGMSAGEYDPGLHAAQFQMFFIVKNIRSGSVDQDNYYWFGVPFFDSRHDIPPSFMATDGGKKDATGKFIYTLGGGTLGEAPLKSGRWVALDADLLPHILKGLREAESRGYLKNSNPHDYAVVNMNMGWEIPGTFDAAVQVQNLEISAVLKESSKAADGRANRGAD